MANRTRDQQLEIFDDRTSAVLILCAPIPVSCRLVVCGLPGCDARCVDREHPGAESASCSPGSSWQSRAGRDTIDLLPAETRQEMISRTRAWR
jgi:hypothetical protein